MIHSLSGGVMHDKKYYNYALVEIELECTCWYIFNDICIKEGDMVLVPLGKNNRIVYGKVISIKKDVMEQMVPYPVNRTKEIYSKV